MSTDLKSHAKNVSLTRFWGGQRGSCVQVTQPRKDTNLEVAFTDKFFTSSKPITEVRIQRCLKPSGAGGASKVDGGFQGVLRASLVRVTSVRV